MASILVFSECDPLAFELLGKAGELGGKMGLVVVAAAFGLSNPQDYLKRGALKVYTSRNELLNNFEAAVYAQVLAQAARESEALLILIGSTRSGKELAGRLSQKMQAGCITDVKSLEWKDNRILCTRNALGGATVATQTILARVQVICVMPKISEPPPKGEGLGEVVDLLLTLHPSRIQKGKRIDKDQGSADIVGAEVLVCVGKGLSKIEDLKTIQELAGALGGQVACTKPLATDQKWLAESRIVGLSGKICQPRLAICLGISGQVQFMVGIREAKTIVAVNTDPNAYIFQMCDYGMIADLHQIVPQLISAIKS